MASNGFPPNLMKKTLEDVREEDRASIVSDKMIEGCQAGQPNEHAAQHPGILTKGL